MSTVTDRLAASELADLLAVVRAGGRLKRSDCLRLWGTNDLTSLGALANLARERTSGNTACYRTTLHFNHTGRPVPSCPECSSAAVGGSSEASPEALAAEIREFSAESIGALHLTGGPDPGVDLDGLCRLVEAASAACPGLHIYAFTWQELEQAAARNCKTPSQTLSVLVDAGLTGIAGGALVDLSPERPHLGQDSIEIMERRMPWIQAAVELELKCELAWIFGDGDDPEILTDTLICIRGIQDHHAIFESCAPLDFRWPGEYLDLPMPTGYNHLRAVAIGRLFLDNIQRIRSSPAAVGEAVAQLAQWYGADDAGSAACPRDSSAHGPTISRDRLSNLLRDAGRDPVER